MLVLFFLTFTFERISTVYLYDYEQSTSRSLSMDDFDFEPMVPLAKDKEKFTVTKNINCDDFSKYALNCTMEAAIIYNSSRKTPPMPAKIGDWCRAIRHLTSCAIDWNADCKDVTESHFNEESIKGHMHVVSNVCDDEWFLTRYDSLPNCIEKASDAWEKCYNEFKNVVDAQKNTTHEWTHFETHFFLCCARAKFRRCTLDSLFESSTRCQHDQAVTMQKFSVIVSEGDVYQDCDHNMLYTNCPGGDPRPSGNQLAKLMNAESIENKAQALQNLNVFVLCFINLFL